VSDAVQTGAERVIVALDAGSTDANVGVVRALAGVARWYKVGMAEFYTAGARLLEEIAEAGGQAFLDLKLHDIPQTVREAARALAPLRPALATVHASGGQAMVKAAVEAFAEAGAETIVLGVTVLTSLDDRDLDAIGLRDGASASVARLAGVAMAGGARGLVCSAHEVAALRGAYPDAVLVTPGIRPAGASVGDQRRVATPAAAIRGGASLLVVGRPIWAAADVRTAFEAIAGEAGEAASGSFGAG
jgi:orotidine-5'-phosphate decarboxylase